MMIPVMTKVHQQVKCYTCNDDGTSALSTPSHSDNSTATSEKCSGFHSVITQTVSGRQLHSSMLNTTVKELLLNMIHIHKSYRIKCSLL